LLVNNGVLSPLIIVVSEVNYLLVSYIIPLLRVESLLKFEIEMKGILNVLLTYNVPPWCQTSPENSKI